MVETRIGKRLRREYMLLLMVMPCVIYYAVFAYIPMYGVTIAFKDFVISKGILGSPWAGLKYFEQLFGSIYFGRLLRNTFVISLLQIGLCFPVPIAFALLLNEVRSRTLKRVVQTASYLPHFISLVVVVGLMMDFFSTQNGLVNRIIIALGGSKVSFFTQPAWFRPLYIGSNIWQETGWNSIIYLAAIAAINPEIYEAAIVDGAGRFRQLLHVTLPGILPTITVLLIMNMGWMFNVGYEKIILMYNDATYEVADVFSTYVYRRGLMEAQYSFGAAMGLFNSVINITILLTVNGISRKVNGYGIF